ncbi:MAG TPA: DUF87 domain-containing protein [Thermoanaerobaculia bacterium]|nr:DUF87 domain-containing protein [Thermoanaerobaculia bacterium]
MNPSLAELAAYEKLGAFYLGGMHVDEVGETAPVPYLYDSKDLVTHALCVGMTGSGKTGLCISLLEEAALDGVPAIVIDPKGDLGNLLLTFPDLAPDDFEPWVDPEAARREGLSVAEYAASQAELWKKGLARWNQDGERIRRLRAAADFRIYTPGSSAGLPVSVLASFAAPPPALAADDDLLRERVATTVSSLLGLVGIDADPVKSREHILLSLLFDDAWRAGRDLDLAALIQSVQQPPVTQVGVMPLDTFYPADDRFELAMALNNLLASPGFASWLDGEPLDVGRMLHAEDGRPRVAIFSIAHLSDAERMFFVSLLLNQTLGWVRSQSGSGSLRALVYMDEVFGFLPPVAEPPSKRPLLTLLKQGRAFGVGTVLATQNPVDLDYKALANIGTWFLGRMQTERDKERLLDGLLGASGSSGLDRGEIDRLLSALGKRVFLAHNVHEEAPVVFHTRWAMSYLAGPLSRDQIKKLTRLTAGTEAGEPAQPAAAAPPSPPVTATPPPLPGAAPAAKAATNATPAARPVLPPEVPQTFVAPADGSATTYAPHALGFARVHFVDDKRGVQHSEDLALLAPLAAPADPDWHNAQEAAFDPEHDLHDTPPAPPAGFVEPPPGLDGKAIRDWEKALSDALYRDRRLELLTAEEVELTARPGEGEGEFRGRIAHALRELRDEEVEKLRTRYAKRIDTQQGRVERAEDKVEREEAQASAKKGQVWVSAGSSILGALLGRKKLSATNVRRAGSVLSGFQRSSKEEADVEQAEEALVREREELEELEAEMQQEVAELTAEYDAQTIELGTVTVKPRRADVEVRRLVLAWVAE